MRGREGVAEEERWDLSTGLTICPALFLIVGLDMLSDLDSESDREDGDSPPRSRVSDSRSSDLVLLYSSLCRDEPLTVDEDEVED